MTTLPGIPTEVWSPLGPVTVTLVEDLCDDEGQMLYGRYSVTQRLIELRKVMHHALHWQTLQHEWCHMVLCDAGIHLSGAKEEAVCDAVATALVGQMLAPPQTYGPLT